MIGRPMSLHSVPGSGPLYTLRMRSSAQFVVAQCMVQHCLCIPVYALQIHLHLMYGTALQCSDLCTRDSGFEHAPAQYSG